MRRGVLTRSWAFCPEAVGVQVLGVEAFRTQLEKLAANLSWRSERLTHSAYCVPSSKAWMHGTLSPHFA